MGTEMAERLALRINGSYHFQHKYFLEIPPVPSGKGVRWTPKPLWAIWRNIKFVTLGTQSSNLADIQPQAVPKPIALTRLTVRVVIITIIIINSYLFTR
jgi:hypothetical protein